MVWDPSKGPVGTGHVGDSDTVMREIARLYLVEQENVELVLDMTWGKGVFWKQIPHRPYRVIGMDNKRKTKGDLRASFYRLPFPDGLFDVVVFDPPFQFGTKAPAVIDGYLNNDRPERGEKAVKGMYSRVLRQEAHRVLRRPVRGGPAGGLAIVKGQDQVESSKVHPFLRYPCFDPCPQWQLEGIFTQVSEGGKPMRHPYQDHPRSTTSQWVVLRRTRVDFPVERPQLTLVEGEPAEVVA